MKDLLPNHIKILLKRLGVPLVFLTLTRIIFYLFNISYFPNASFFDFIAGIWFDLITIALYYAPLILVYILPVPIRGYHLFQVSWKWLFIIILLILFSLNLTDIVYYAYTNKRSTSDLLSFLASGSDIFQLIPTLLTEFWYLFILLFLFIWGTNKLYLKIGEDDSRFSTWSKSIFVRDFLSFIVALPIFIIVARGGIQLRPVGIVEVSKYTTNENAPIVLNTPFAMIKSLGKQGVEQKNYFSSIELTKDYINPVQKSNPLNILPKNTNVVLVILESFGKEFIGFYQKPDGKYQEYTPFLDSILSQSLTYEYAFANGKKSIEAVSSIFAGLPSWMETPYISSPYSANRIIGLPEILKSNGYETAFFHGATNGSMRFDAFTSQIGIDNYFGRTEYNNDEHFDGNWGILDEYFNPWSAKKMSELKEPFFASLFTVSSHHPYYIPENRKDIIRTGDQPLCASINYGDYALRKFFEEAKKQPWYENTLFVICADHTPSTLTRAYIQRTHCYQIPIAYYHPKGLIQPELSQQIAQQADIMPTVLDLLNIKTEYYSFGESHYTKKNNYAISYLQGYYYLFKDDHLLIFIDDQPKNLFNFTDLNESPIDSIEHYSNKQIKEMTNIIKANIQRYNNDVILNQTHVK